MINGEKIKATVINPNLATRKSYILANFVQVQLLFF